MQSYTETTDQGPLIITPIFHGSVRLNFRGKEIHIDPWSKGDYSNFKSADLIIVTHPHQDHLDPDLIRKLSKDDTKIVVNSTSEEAIKDLNPTVLRNGEDTEILGIKIEAIPAYNLVRERSPGIKYHPKGEGNGYILTLGSKRMFIPGDTEATPEIENLKNIDISFIPIRLPYTMSGEEAGNVIAKFKPKICFPYHTGGQPVPKDFLDILDKVTGVDVRVIDALKGN